MKYEWRHVDTNEVVTVERDLADYQVPPDDSGKWVRVYSLSFARVEGAGGSPSGYVDQRRRYEHEGT